MCKCEAWSLTLRELYGVTVFVNRVLRKIFGPKRDEDTGGWLKLLNEDLHRWKMDRACNSSGE
jgi:hypothetical protein